MIARDNESLATRTRERDIACMTDANMYIGRPRITDSCQLYEKSCAIAIVKISSKQYM